VNVNKEKIKELLALFDASDIEELEFQHSFWRGTHVRLSRRSTVPPPVQQVVAAPSVVQQAPPPLAPVETAAAVPAPEASPKPSGHIIKAPMVGTMYYSPSPEADPFVREGDRVRKGQTLLLIEAMKIMNEIEADIDGQVVKILVGNAEPVEYNQPLIELAPA
jgi:acetyl-CoA carboxylase biotin carboxyl carrier protein